MALKPKKAKTANNFKAEVIEPDSYPARVVQVIDLGTQPQPAFQGTEKPPRHTLWVTYEMVDLFMKDNDGNELEDKPRWFSERLALFPLESERAKSTQRYKAIDPKNKFDGDFSQILGQPCIVMVDQYKKKDGTLGNGIGAVSPIMRGMVVPELSNEPKLFLMDEPDMEVFNDLPDFLKDLIKGSSDFPGSDLEALLAGEKPAPKKEPEEEPEATPEAQDEDSDEDTPW